MSFYATNSTTTGGNLSLTSMKRKRNEEEDDPFTSILKMSNARSFIRRYPLPTEIIDLIHGTSVSTPVQFHLLKTGDLVILSEDIVTVYKNFYERSKEFEFGGGNDSFSNGSIPILTAQFPIPMKDIHFIDCITEYFPKSKIFKRKELFLATNSGILFFLDLLVDSPRFVEPVIQRIHLSEEKAGLEELLLDYKLLKQGIVFVSNIGEVYLIDKPSLNKITADKLTRPTGNLLFGLLQTGVKSLFGFGTGLSASASTVPPKYSQVLTLSSSSLITVGSFLTLWNNYQNPGSEKLIYQYEEFASDIKRDISNMIKKDVKISFLQIEAPSLSQETSESVSELDGKRVLLLLTASTESSYASEVTPETVASLWLHFVQIPVYSTEIDSNTNTVEIKILHRIQLTQEAVIHQAEQATSFSSAAAANPKIFSMPLVWRVFVSWISHSERSLHSIQIDVFNQISVAQSGGKAEFADVKAYSSDTHIEDGRALTLQALDNVDGICGIVSDSEEVVLIAPRLPMTHVNRPLGIPVGVNAASETQNQNERAKISNLLLKISYKKSTLETDIGQLRNVFIGFPIETIKDLIIETSFKIINRSPVGQLWGSSSAIEGGTSTLSGQSTSVAVLSAGGTVETADRAINEYQLVHRLLHDKVHQHHHLLMAIIEADAVRYEEIIIFLLQNHQKVLFTHAFSDAIQDLMGELPLPREYFAAMNYLAESITDYITGELGIRIDEIKSKGLSIFDQFYAQTEKFYDAVHFIFQGLIQKLKSRQKLDFELIRILYFYLLLLNAAISKTVQGDGGEDYKTSVAAHPLVREVVLNLAHFLLQSLQLIQESTMTIQLKNKIFATFLEEKEGKQLAELFRLVLEGYEKESQVHFPKEAYPAEFMEEDWQREYHLTKDITIQLLLSFHYYHHVFMLSQDYHYNQGLFLATEKQPKRYQAVLEELIELQGNRKDTNAAPLALEYFTYLHERSRLHDILVIGRKSERLLEEFLKTKPHLSALYHIQEKRYDIALKASYEHGVAVIDQSSTASDALALTGKAKTFFSLAKLCGKVHDQAAADKSVSFENRLQPLSFIAAPLTAQASAAASVAPAIKRSTQTVPRAEVKEIELNVQKQLALLRIEEDVYQYLPRMIPPSSSTATGTKKTETSTTSSRSARLISNLIRFLKDLRQLPQFPPDVTPEVLVKVIGEILRIFEIEFPTSSSSSSISVLPPDMAVNRCVELWKEILLLNESEWLNYAMISMLTKGMEQELKQNCFFYLILSPLYEEHSRKLKTASSVVEAEEKKKAWWYSPIYSTQLLQAVLEESELIYKCMNEDGEIKYTTTLEKESTSGQKELQEDQLQQRKKNERVLNVIQSCIALIHQDVTGKIFSS